MSDDESENKKPNLRGYSLDEMINLSQDQISQMVFTFRKDAETVNINSGNNYTEMQDAIFGVPSLANISKENLPTFQYF